VFHVKLNEPKAVLGSEIKSCPLKVTCPPPPCQPGDIPYCPFVTIDALLEKLEDTKIGLPYVKVAASPK
jgi:hypothetical protein